MKITLLQSELETGLQHIQKAIPSKPSLPILSSVMVTTNKTTCTLAATDMYFGVRTTIPLIEETTEDIAVIPGKQFREFIASLPSANVSLVFEEGSVVITSESSKTSLQCLNSQEYPAFPEISGYELEIPASVIQTIDQWVCFSASNDQARPVLTSLLFDLSKDGLTVVATDGFRLSTLSFPEAASEDTIRFLLPAKAFQEVSRIMKSTKCETLRFTVSEELKQVLCTCGDVELFIRLIQGEYPPYEKIIPSLFTTEVLFDGEELTEHIKRALIFARDSSNIVSFSFDPDQTVIAAKSPAYGTFEGQLKSIKVTGEPAEIAFNARYVLDFLQSAKGQTVWFGMSESLKPALFKAESEPNLQYVIMPFKVNN